MNYVNVYLHDKCYGGPEEGGWWYDTYAPVLHSEVVNRPGGAWDASLSPKPLVTDLHDGDGVERIASYRATPKRIERLERWAARMNRGRRPVHSVLSGGEYRVRVERHRPRHEPSYRPHYE